MAAKPAIAHHMFDNACGRRVPKLHDCHLLHNPRMQPTTRHARGG